MGEWVPGEEEHQIRPRARVGDAGDAGEARGEQEAALVEREGRGWRKHSNEPFTPTPALFGDKPPNRIIRFLLESDIPIVG